jgi:hypothetical protein
MCSLQFIPHLRHLAENTQRAAEVIYLATQACMTAQVVGRTIAPFCSPRHQSHPLFSLPPNPYFSYFFLFHVFFCRCSFPPLGQLRAGAPLRFKLHGKASEPTPRRDRRARGREQAASLITPGLVFKATSAPGRALLLPITSPSQLRSAVGIGGCEHGNWG